uniref:Uncharacterized protein n=1 Tax=Rhizophagus irregularis (strain DAOM 181602 / DAOM 197198 / MUCL 43194) TaxID=747089 RepID=U9TK50_RHIID
MAFFRKYLKLRCLYKRKKDYVKKDKPVAEKGKRSWKRFLSRIYGCGGTFTP